MYQLNFVFLFFVAHSDGRPHVPRRQAILNKETFKDFVVPRSQRPPTSAACRPDSEEFKKELWDKLENLRRERLLLQHQLNLSDPSDNSSRLPPIPSRNQTNFHVQLVSDLRRFQLEEDNDQSILDQHVSRVWSDLTPHRSPGTISPCPAVPNRRRTHDSVTTGGDGKQIQFFFCNFQSTKTGFFWFYSWSIDATFEINARSWIVVETAHP